LMGQASTTSLDLPFFLAAGTAAGAALLVLSQNLAASPRPIGYTR
jgi:hypothetical protein